MTSLQRYLVGLLLIVAGSAAVHAAPVKLPPQEGRMALLIGVRDYEGDAKLKTPLNDIAMIEKSLRELGFSDLRSLPNPGLAQITAAIDKFQADVAEKKKRGVDTTAVIYFAGHGIVVDNKAYLLPSDFDVQIRPSAEYAEANAVELERMAEDLRDTGAARVLIIIDACRNNPWEGGERPRVPVAFDSNLPSRDAIIQAAALLLSAGTGGTALDSSPTNPDNSPFALALSSEILNSENRSSQEAFAQVRAAVATQTGQRGSIHGFFEVNLTVDDGVLQKEALQKRERYLALLAREQTKGISTDTGRRVSNVASNDIGIPRYWSERYTGDPCKLPLMNFNPIAYYYRYVALYGERILASNAQAGRGCEQYLLGISFTLLGRLDYAGAIDNLERAYRNGIKPAATTLMSVYDGSAYGWPADSEQYRRWGEVAIAQKLPGGIRNYGSCLLLGCAGLAKDAGKGLALLQIAAKMGHADAALRLARYFGSRRYGVLDLKLSINWFEESLRLGSVDAPDEYGRLLFFGSPEYPGLRVDRKRGLEILEKGGLKGNANALWTLAGIYSEDKDYRDPGRAFASRLRAAKAGDPEAMVLVARSFASGEGAARNSAEARRWYEEAASSNEPDGFLGLANFFEVEGRISDAITAARRALSYESAPTAAQIWPMSFYTAGMRIQELFKKDGAPAIDAAEQRWLARNYGELGNLKRYTVPLKCHGALTPYNVYVFDWARSESPVASQLRWVENYRPCEVAEDVRSGFEALYRIAGENGVSYADLVFYALGDAKYKADTVKVQADPTKAN